MTPDPFDRREFLAAGGGLFLCTLAGHKFKATDHVDVDKLAAGVPVPPKVAAAERAGTTQLAAQRETVAATSGTIREYWIRAEPVKWNIVPSGRDEMMNKKVKSKTKFTAWAYRAYSANFKEPLGPATIPGPQLSGEVGDSIVVHFQNRLDTPVTIHPHGIFYANDMDGAYKGKYTDPSGFVQRNRTFTYVWDCREGTEGTWLYHDHGPMDPMPLFKGLFGTIVIRPAGGTPPDVEFTTVFHSFQPLATGLSTAYSCINGRSYAGNTPTLRSSVGQKVAWHVMAIDDEFHTFHIHGHRWVDNDGGAIIDNKTLGPGDAITAEFTEDNPGRWFYHCHVFSHLHMGMNGWYIVS